MNPSLFNEQEELVEQIEPMNGQEGHQQDEDRRRSQMLQQENFNDSYSDARATVTTNISATNISPSSPMITTTSVSNGENDRNSSDRNVNDEDEEDASMGGDSQTAVVENSAAQTSATTAAVTTTTTTTTTTQPLSENTATTNNTTRKRKVITNSATVPDNNNNNTTRRGATSNAEEYQDAFDNLINALVRTDPSLFMLKQQHQNQNNQENSNGHSGGDDDCDAEESNCLNRIAMINQTILSLTRLKEENELLEQVRDVVQARRWESREDILNHTTAYCLSAAAATTTSGHNDGNASNLSAEAISPTLRNLLDGRGREEGTGRQDSGRQDGISTATTIPPDTHTSDDQKGEEELKRE